MKQDGDDVVGGGEGGGDLPGVQSGVLASPLPSWPGGEDGRAGGGSTHPQFCCAKQEVSQSGSEKTELGFLTQNKTKNKTKQNKNGLTLHLLCIGGCWRLLEVVGGC